MSVLLPVILAFAASLAAGLAIILTCGRHLHVTGRRSLGPAVQTMHTAPAPQIGGLALLGGLIAGLVVLRHGDPAEAEAGELAMIALLCGLPILMTGMMEDVGKGARPALRLLAAFAASALAMEMTGTRLVHGGFAGGDALLAFAPFAVAFTIFATAGATHAFNLVDGVHGLALGTAMAVSLSLAAVAGIAGDAPMAVLALLTTAALAGLFVLNFPHGRIFLGDTGAYGIGHFLTWSAVLILWRNPDVTPWAMLLIFFWPILETVFSIGRRLVTRRPFGQPDRLHFHHIVLRLIETRWLGRARRDLANPMTSVMLLPLIGAIGALGVWSMANTGHALLLLLTVTGLYTLVYFTLRDLHRGTSGAIATTRRRRRRLIRRRKAEQPAPVLLAAPPLAPPALAPLAAEMDAPVAANTDPTTEGAKRRPRSAQIAAE